MSVDGEGYDVGARRLMPVLVGAGLAWVLSTIATVLAWSQVRQVTEGRLLVTMGVTVLVSGLVAGALAATLCGRRVAEPERAQAATLAAAGAAGYLVLSSLLPLLGGATVLAAVSLAAALAGPAVGGAVGFALSHR